MGIKDFGIMIINGNKITRSKGGSTYDGEKIPGDLSGWDTYSTDPNEILESSYGTLQKRSMTLAHTYGPAIAAINKPTNYSIGPGLVWRSQPDFEGIGKSKEWAKDWGKEAQKIIHWRFQEMNFYEKQSVMMRGAKSIGDCGLHFERKDGYLTDLIEFGGDDIDWEKKDDGYYLGVKHDKYKRRTGLQLLSGDEIDFKDAAGNQNAIQLLFKQFPRQLRGYPLLYSIINLCKQDDRHWDATVKRAVMEAVIMASAKTAEGSISDQLNNADDIGEENKRGGAFTRVLARFGQKDTQPGTVLNFGANANEGWEFHDIKTPSDNFDPFKRWIIYFIAMATGYPPEIIMGLYTSSYSARQGAFNDFIKAYMMDRMTFERIVIRPVVKEILSDAIRQGYLSAPGFFEFPRAQWAYLQGMTLGPVPGAINPKQEVDAQKVAVENGFQLRSNVAALYGNEWDNMIEEWGEEQAEFFRLSPEKQAEAVQQQEEKNADDNNQGGDE